MSNTSESGRVAKRELWRHEVERWQQSGLSMRAFCRQKNISYYGLRYWKEHAWPEAESSRAVRISIPVTAAAVATESAIIEVVVAERFRVRIPEGVRSSELERVIRSLEAVR